MLRMHTSPETGLSSGKSRSICSRKDSRHADFAVSIRNVCERLGDNIAMNSGTYGQQKLTKCASTSLPSLDESSCLPTLAVAGASTPKRRAYWL